MEFLSVHAKRIGCGKVTFQGLFGLKKLTHFTQALNSKKNKSNRGLTPTVVPPSVTCVEFKCLGKKMAIMRQIKVKMIGGAELAAQKDRQ